MNITQLVMILKSQSKIYIFTCSGELKEFFLMQNIFFKKFNIFDQLRVF